MAATEYDVVVIGGGSGGLSAAERCAARGLRTALVERDRLGGECLWTGCIPAKAMLYSAEVQHMMARAGDFGLTSCAQELVWPPSSASERRGCPSHRAPQQPGAIG